MERAAAATREGESMRQSACEPVKTFELAVTLSSVEPTPPPLDTKKVKGREGKKLTVTVVALWLLCAECRLLLRLASRACRLA